MTPEEQRICLMRTLAGEMPQYRKVEIPEDEAGQKQLIRALMNVRPPLPPGREFLEIQDTYLRDGPGKGGEPHLSLAGGYNQAEGGCHCKCSQQRAFGMLSSAALMH